MEITKQQIEKIEKFVSSRLDSLNWFHTQEVRKIALKLARIEKADKDIVEVAALLHDVGKCKGDKDHIQRSEGMARNFLEKAGFEQNFVEEVIYCIAVHEYQWMGKAHLIKTREAKVLGDADIIQKLSVWGILKKTIEYQDEFRKNYQEALIMLRDKLLRRYNLLVTKSGQDLAEPGYKFVKDFFKELL